MYSSLYIYKRNKLCKKVTNLTIRIRSWRHHRIWGIFLVRVHSYDIHFEDEGGSTGLYVDDTFIRGNRVRKVQQSLDDGRRGRIKTSPLDVENLECRFIFIGTTSGCMKVYWHYTLFLCHVTPSNIVQHQFVLILSSIGRWWRHKNNLSCKYPRVPVAWICYVLDFLYYKLDYWGPPLWLSGKVMYIMR
jgi:hypothetical protein